MATLTVALSTGTRTNLLCNSVVVLLVMYDYFCNTSILLSNSTILSLQFIKFDVGKVFCSDHNEIQPASFKIFFLASWKLMGFFSLNFGSPKLADAAYYS